MLTHPPTILKAVETDISIHQHKIYAAPPAKRDTLIEQDRWVVKNAKRAQ